MRPHRAPHLIGPDCQKKRVEKTIFLPFFPPIFHLLLCFEILFSVEILCSHMTHNVSLFFTTSLCDTFISNSTFISQQPPHPKMSHLPAEVLMTTSKDPRYPELNMVDGNMDTFWTTTGMFPQEVLVGFQERTVSLSRLKTWSHGIRRLAVQASCETQPIKFKSILDVELSEKSGSSLQTETFQINSTVGSGVRFVKIILQTGWEDFATVHNLVFEGELLEEEVTHHAPAQATGPPAQLQTLNKD